MTFSSIYSMEIERGGVSRFIEVYILAVYSVEETQSGGGLINLDELYVYDKGGQTDYTKRLKTSYPKAFERLEDKVYADLFHAPH